MSQHLPECPMANGCKHDYYNDPPIQCADCGESCICDRLRACEQRVSSEFLTPMALAFTGMSDPRYAKGYAAGLDAAREAVGSMVIEIVGNSAATVGQAVSVIDALREKT